MIMGRVDYDESAIDPNIPKDEPVFLFRGQDMFLPLILEKYAQLLSTVRAEQHMIDSVLAHVQRIKVWQRLHRAKVPDMPAPEAQQNG